MRKELDSARVELKTNILGDGDIAIFKMLGRDSNWEFNGMIESISKYPIYDVSIFVTNFNQAIKCRTKNKEGKLIVDIECFLAESSKNVALKSNDVLQPFLLNYTDYKINHREEKLNLEITISARSFHIIQQSVFELKRGKICDQSLRIFKVIPEKDSVSLYFTDNNLNLPDEYWEKNFFTLKHRSYESIPLRILIIYVTKFSYTPLFDLAVVGVVR